ncbi:hypothetical protein AG1IA_03061 [Rhizoctonia solani AG-1 IA]|uniref:Uncharacterized protein n=1 Tax=Thanatephorus cucumeris (strain AG1-IA) TaxID=983506 RepID=L8WY40_THACA|nr:hypothetical protein AG1IA_03061 [Rhizoctonia solani AG-1 IA]
MYPEESNQDRRLSVLRRTVPAWGSVVGLYAAFVRQAHTARVHWLAAGGLHGQLLDPSFGGVLGYGCVLERRAGRRGRPSLPAMRGSSTFLVLGRVLGTSHSWQGCMLPRALLDPNFSKDDLTRAWLVRYCGNPTGRNWCDPCQRAHCWRLSAPTSAFFLYSTAVVSPRAPGALEHAVNLLYSRVTKPRAKVSQGRKQTLCASPLGLVDIRPVQARWLWVQG